MPPTRKLAIIAQDPSIRGPDEKILRATVAIPYEDLSPGPRGYRVQVVDYDASQRVLYEPAVLNGEDRFARVADATLLSDPAFHAQNAYAVVMRVLQRFEFALGRRLTWGFGGHQINVAPHAFADSNAYYSEEDRGLFFGYFPGGDGKPVFTCLSHDVIAHEATHALLDGLRDSYTFPSGPDQAGFHEGFADVVALLSMFGLPDVVRALLREKKPGTNQIEKQNLTGEAIRDNVLLGLAEQFGQETSAFRESALRRAVKRPPRKGALQEPDFEECHLRGEILSAAVLNAFVDVWEQRLASWLPAMDETVARDRVVEDGADAAEQLLTMCIRALDYCPVVDLSFGDFLSALLTADVETVPDDSKYGYRQALREQFGRWGIAPSSGVVPKTPKAEAVHRGDVPEPGAWEHPKEKEQLDYECVHREFMQRDADEVFRFLWDNRRALRIYEDAYTRVVSVRPCVRVGPEGFVLRETVTEYLQLLDLEAGQLKGLAIAKPKAMPDTTPVRLYGGGVLVFDDFGHLKYHVRSRLDNAQRQSKRLDYLWRNRIKDTQGRYGFSDGVPEGQRFALMHRRRAGQREQKEEWDG